MTLTGLVCFNTNLAAAVATCVTMIFTWLRYGKPDVSMTLNGSLAGLVAITAGCDTVSPFGAFFIGFVAGILVVLSVEFFDKIAKVDDPVGAVSVHFANGVWGTIAVGLFSTCLLYTSPAKFGASSSRPIACGNRVPPSDHSLGKLPGKPDVYKRQGQRRQLLAAPVRHL